MTTSPSEEKNIEEPTGATCMKKQSNHTPKRHPRHSSHRRIGESRKHVRLRDPKWSENSGLSADQKLELQRETERMIEGNIETNKNPQSNKNTETYESDYQKRRRAILYAYHTLFWSPGRQEWFGKNGTLQKFANCSVSLLTPSAW